MALTFPGSPSVNQIYVDATSGNVYQWNGTVWINYNTQNPKNILELDDISGSFNGSTATFALTSSSKSVTPAVASQIIVNIGGVAQNAGTDFTVSGSNITFTTAPTSGLTFSGFVFGGNVPLSSFDNGSITPYSLTAGGPVWDSTGNITITGIATVGSSSVTINGSTNRITVGTGATISSTGITAGIITATLYGSGANLTGVGIGTTGSINTSGIITATSFYGDGSGLTNIGGLLEPLIYNPGIGATNIGISTNITLTFQKPIAANSGTITLRENSASGTIVESFDISTVGSSSSITISGATLTIDPTSNLGAGTTYYAVFPAAVVEDSMNTSTSVGISSYYFVTETIVVYGSLFVFGSPSSGSLGLNDTVDRSSPTQLPGTQWSIIDFNPFAHTFGLKTDGTLWAWGYGGYGATGQNDLVNRSSPHQIPGTQWKSIKSRYQGGNATKTDGTLWAWGRNNSGSLGQNDGSNFYISSPVQIPGTQWDKIIQNAENSNISISKTDGTIWMIGGGGDGAFADNTNISRSSPTQIPGTQWDVDNVSLSYKSSIGRKTDGTLWAWGAGGDGMIGINDRVSRSSPTQIPGTQWESIFDTGRYNTFSIKTDKTLWVWGHNSYGKLGLNDTVFRSSPTQLPGTQWSSGYSSNYSTILKKTDGSVWTIGRNHSGQLGQNSLVYYSSPIQIPGTQWGPIQDGGYTFGILKSSS